MKSPSIPTGTCDPFRISPGFTQLDTVLDEAFVTGFRTLMRGSIGVGIIRFSLYYLATGIAYIFINSLKCGLYIRQNTTTYGVDAEIIYTLDTITDEEKISSLADTIVFFRPTPDEGELRNILGILISRPSDFAQTLRELETIEDGCKLGGRSRNCETYYLEHPIGLPTRAIEQSLR